MTLETFSIQQVLTVLTSTAVGALITLMANRRKTNAEALLATAQTKLTEIEVYSTLVKDMKTQLDRQQDQIANQQKQIVVLQEQNTEYLRTINASGKRELALQRRVKQLEKELEELKNTLPNEKI